MPRLTFQIDDDAAAQLRTLAGPHKQGTYLSELIRRAAAEQGNGQAPVRDDVAEAARRAGDPVAAELGAVLARLAALEARVQALEPRGGDARP